MTREWRHADPTIKHKPTPDPASPCGRIAASVACGYPASDPVMHGDAYVRLAGWRVRFTHPHQPTRCTCGHPIEERA